MLKDTTSHGLYDRVWPPHTIERRGGGEVMSKEVGEEERGVRRSGQEERHNATSVDVEIYPHRRLAATRPTLLFAGRPL